MPDSAMVGDRAARIREPREARPAAAVLNLSRYAWSVVATTALGFGLRVFLVGTPPLWRDEAFTAVAIRNPVPELLDIVRHDSAPPLSYLLVKLVSAISASPGSLRLVSVLAGTAMVPVAAALGRRLAGDRAGILAGAAMAVMPAYVLQARDLRMYALASSLVLACALALWRAVERPTRIRLATYFALVVLAAYSHYFAVLAVGSQVVVALVLLRPPLATAVRVCLAAGLGLLALVPWLIAAIPQFQHADAPFWVTPFDLGRAEDLFQQFATGGAIPGSFASSDSLNQLRVVACASAAAAALATVAAVVRAGSEPRRRIGFMAACGIVPVAALLLISVRRPVFDPRYAAVMWAPLVPLLGVGLAWLSRPRWCVALAVAGLLPLGGYSLVAGPNPPNDDLRTVTSPLAAEVRPEDFIAVDGALPYFPVLYYTPPSMAPQVHVIAGSVRWFDGTAQFRPDTWMTAVSESARGRVYVIDRVRATNLTLPAGYTLQDMRCGNDFCLQTWSR